MCACGGVCGVVLELVLGAGARGYLRILLI